MGKINEIKSNLETFISDVNINELKNSFNQMIKDAQKDFKGRVDKDLEAMKKKLHKEKEDFEQKAKGFLDNHKKELVTLQAKLDKLVKAAEKLRQVKVKAPKAGVTTKKKITKKVAKSSAKPGFKPKSTRKAPVKA